MDAYLEEYRSELTIGEFGSLPCCVGMRTLARLLLDVKDLCFLPINMSGHPARTLSG